MVRICALVFTLVLIGAQDTFAQRFAGEWAWNELLEFEGVTFKYIYYREADNVDDGVVVMLENTNDYAVEYRFRIVFRAAGDEVEMLAEGELEAKALKTGDADGLFFIPFDDGRTIGEVGLRGYKVTRAERYAPA